MIINSKKIAILFIGLLASSVGLADQTSTSNDDYPLFFNISGALVDMGLPSFSTQSLGTRHAQGNSLSSSSFSDWGTDTVFTAGLHFNRSTFLGQQTSLAFQYGQLQANGDQNQGAMGNAVIRMINGQGLAFNNVIDSVAVDSTTLKNSFNDNDFKLLMIGDNTAGKTVYHPSLGVVFHDAIQKIKYNMNYEDPFGASLVDIEKYDLYARYYGVTIGNEIDTQFAPKWDLQMTGSLEGLYLPAKLQAYQDYNYSPGDAESPAAEVPNYTTSMHRYTYMANANLGIFYSFTDKKNTPNVGLVGGLSNWGAYPKIMTPDSAHPNRATYLASRNILNGFVGLQLNIPIV